MNDRGPAPSEGGQKAKPASSETMDSERKPIAVAEVRQSLAAKGGPEYWRTLEELAGREDFQTLIEQEFPRYAPQEWEDGVSRRSFLHLAGASLGLAGLTACTRQPEERIVPYVEQPEHVIPGRPTYFATGMTLGGYGYGLIAESHEGRPTKLAGNPQHPASLGATDLIAQAATLDLYDPDRSQSILSEGRIRPWSEFVTAMAAPLKALEALGGEGLRILTGTQTSPTFGALIAQVEQRFPKAGWVQFESASEDSIEDAAQMAFGESVATRFDLSKADVVVALDSDFLCTGPGHLRYARDFAAGRSVRGGKNTMNRLYALETTPTRTGSMADHRLPARRAELGRFAAALAARLNVTGVRVPSLEDAELSRWLDVVAQDLEQHRGRCLVVAGAHTEPELQALVHAINTALGNVGTTVEHTDPVRLRPANQTKALRRLTEEMQNGDVAAIFILGANPAYSAPGDIDFVAALEKVDLTVHMGSHLDETAALCKWHVPQAHFLEGWGDARSHDGTITAIQPLIEPLYEGKTDLQMLSVLAGRDSSDYDLVRSHWQSLSGEGFERVWRHVLHDGYLAGSARTPREVNVDWNAIGRAANALASASAATGTETVEVSFRPDTNLYDGRFANNGWLQEVPRPLTQITWDNAALMAPATAEALGFGNFDVVRLEADGRSIDLPLLVNPGQAPGTVTVHLGYGRTKAGRVGTGVGVNANALRSADSPWERAGVTVMRTGLTHKLATTQEHFQLDVQSEQAEKRHLVKHATLAYYKEHPDFVDHMGHTVSPDKTMFPDWEYEGYAWGMAIDLSACTACHACVVACQAENNIPVVGREQVINGREMHWIRIDRYYQGSFDNPTVHHQPMACQHCEKAPCEIVCPVAATVHGPEGLNEMVYNRCVGTRYCSNNCPYKVRRFNFLRYNDYSTPVLKLSRNPNVSVRMRGVMEKCTYCVQRINAARQDAKVERRKIADGEIKTACQEVCPSQAIAFGDTNDPGSEVSKWKQESLDYNQLDELSTAPRTTYLAKLRNPNPALFDEHGSPDDAHGDAHGA